MTRASDNAFPSILITEGTEPSAPAAGKQRLYIDSTTHKLKRTNSSGTDVDIEGSTAGAELDFVEITSPVSLTATSEATANTCITGNSVAYDGSTRVKIEWYAPYVASPAAGSGFTILTLYDGSSSIGLIGLITNNAGTALQRWFGYGCRFLTPSNASHTYSLRGYVSGGTGTLGAGAGGSTAHMPAFLRITRA